MRAHSSGLRVSIAVLAGLALLGCALIGRHAPQQAATSYLAAYVFFLGLALGSLALLMVHALTDGGWGADLRPSLLAASRVLPILGLLFVPLLLCAGPVYPWVAPATHPLGASGPQLVRQGWYLNLPFFIGRAVGCFVLWIWLAGSLRRRLLPGSDARLARFAALGLILYLLSVTVAAVDWVMSLVPAWHSSIFGLLIGTGQLMTGAALAVATSTSTAESGRLRDLGSLLLALILGWAYLAFMDYLTAWSADLPGETVWYLPRLRTSWQWLALGFVTCQFALPFALLLATPIRKSRSWLRFVATLLLLSQAAYALWIVLPGSRPGGVALGWTDLLAWLGLGGLCWAAFDLRLAQREHVRREA
ncbi:MAG TPA: hypothetical protein VFO44_09685 [Steroidobacteraceae bacterium]|nr:hypothetical protein [Steroidobacteraceae bacterium]